MKSVSAEIIDKKIIQVDKGKCPAKIVMAHKDGTKREIMDMAAADKEMCSSVPDPKDAEGEDSPGGAGRGEKDG